MKNPSPDSPPAPARRRFVRTLALGGAGAFGLLQTGAALPAAAAAPANPAPAKLDVKDPAAAALGYVEDAAQVDPKKYPAYTKGSNCENCLQLQGKSGSDYRPCSLFPGKLVAIAGWCSGWTAEM